ncbi:glycoside hydrolase family 18 protein [Lysinibacillus sp. KU-BSD001]|uniref:LysM peptidoglycan-binding domain-containing protein n=1 Tax=Lysinibacillus sp. KU-BSD001 TaxID=3141328 RepID=UPI0036EBA981
MQIHVVQPGQSLYGIAQAYRTTAQAIAQANELRNPNQLVVGQALVIPIYGSFYWVQPGDSLYRIAQRFGLEVNTLAQINRLNVNAPLAIGIQLYIPPRPKTEIEALAFLEPRGDEISALLLQQAMDASRNLTYLSLFSLEAKRDGSLRTPPSNGIENIVETTGAAVMLVVTNLEAGQFSGELMRDILQSIAVQELMLENIISYAEQLGGVKAVMFDLEHIPGDQKTAYNQFLQRAVERLHEVNLVVCVALAPKTRADQPGEWFVAHDYKAVGQIVDFVMLMTYEWGYSAGPPLPVSPIKEVERVLNYAVTEMPPNKIIMGQNLYGYDWTLPFVPGGAYARAVSPQAAIQLAVRYNASIQYDTTAQAPFIEYVDDEGKEHIVWFEDARSIQAKFLLLKEFKLRGIGYWKLGLSFPQNWLLLEEYFTIKKV